MNSPHIRLVVMGASAGGIAALGEILPSLPMQFPLPIVIVVHLSPTRQSLLPEIFDRKCALPVTEVFDKVSITPGCVYFSPPDYHLLIENGLTCALSVDNPVNYSRPSIDVLFESAAASVGKGVLAIVLTGTGADGARGLKAVRDAGGIGWVQSPDTAQSPVMPRSAIEIGGADAILTLPQIAERLARLES